MDEYTNRGKNTILQLIIAGVVLVVVAAAVALILGSDTSQTPDDVGSTSDLDTEVLKPAEPLVFEEVGQNEYSMLSLDGDIVHVDTSEGDGVLVKAERWGGEGELALTLPTASNVTMNNGRIEYLIKDGYLEGANMKVAVYPLQPEEMVENDFSFVINEQGGFKFDTILYNQPGTNVFSYAIETNGLDFHYQPALTQEEIDGGAYRPEIVVGSYAVYHSEKRGDQSLVDGNDYKTGKAFHIYRPEIYDAAGNTVWGELNVDEENGELTVTVPQEFLDSAVYPVVVDPIVGYDSIGATIDNNAGGKQLGSWFTAPADVTVTTMTTHFDYVIRYGGPMQSAIYQYVSDTDVGTQVGLTACSNIASSGSDYNDVWISRDFSSGVSLTSGTSYYLLTQAPQYSNRVRVPYDTVAGKGMVGTTNPGNLCSGVTWGDPWVLEGAVDRQYSIYASYSGPPPTCDGMTATLYVEDGYVVDTQGGPLDGVAYTAGVTVLDSSSGPFSAVIVGTDAADVIFSDYSGDVVCAGAGDDTITLNNQSPTVYAEDGNDTIIDNGSAGNLYVEGGNDDDYIEVRRAGTVYGNAGNDQIVTRDSFAGSITFYAGLGDDYIEVDTPGSVYGEEGRDLIVVSGSYAGTATVYGDDGDDQIFQTGSSAGDFRGGAGNDLICAGTGSVLDIFGDADSDILSSVGNYTAFDGGTGTDSCYGTTDPIVSFAACETQDTSGSGAPECAAGAPGAAEWPPAAVRELFYDGGEDWTHDTDCGVGHPWDTCSTFDGFTGTTSVQSVNNTVQGPAVGSWYIAAWDYDGLTDYLEVSFDSSMCADMTIDFYVSAGTSLESGEEAQMIISSGATEYKIYDSKGNGVPNGNEEDGIWHSHSLDISDFISSNTTLTLRGMPTFTRESDEWHHWDEIRVWCNEGTHTNAAPATPTITGPTSGEVNVEQTFDVSSVDSDGDVVRYGFDWDNDTTVDEWVPSTGYQTSGVSESVGHSWSSAGNYTFAVYAEDSHGALSVAGTHDITINFPAGYRELFYDGGEDWTHNTNCGSGHPWDTCNDRAGADYIQSVNNTVQGPAVGSWYIAAWDIDTSESDYLEVSFDSSMCADMTVNFYVSAGTGLETSEAAKMSISTDGAAYTKIYDSKGDGVTNGNEEDGNWHSHSLDISSYISPTTSLKLHGMPTFTRVNDEWHHWDEIVVWCNEAVVPPTVSNPGNPTISGPATGQILSDYTFTFQATDTPAWQNVEVMADSINDYITEAIYVPSLSQYVAVGHSTGNNVPFYARLYTSSDMETWTTYTIDNGTGLYPTPSAVVYDSVEGEYLVVGKEQNYKVLLWRSTDLLTWTETQIEDPANTTYTYDMIYEGGNYVIVGRQWNGSAYDAVVWSASETAGPWTKVAIQNGTAWDVEYDSGSGTYVVAGKNNSDEPMLWESTNLSTWTPRPITGVSWGWVFDIERVGSTWFASGFMDGGTSNDATIWSSSNLTSWTEHTVSSDPSDGESVYELKYDSTTGIYYAAGVQDSGNAEGRVWISKDLNTWQELAIQDIRFGQGSDPLAINTASEEIMVGGYILGTDADAFASKSSTDIGDIRYGIDWDEPADGIVDEWVPVNTPSDQYVFSGISASTTHQWSESGSRTFRVLTEDNDGNQSGWSTGTIDISGTHPYVMARNIQTNSLTNPTNVTTGNPVLNADYAGSSVFDTLATTWDYYREIEIENDVSAETLTDFQVKITFDSQNLVSSGKLQANCADLRFVDPFEDVIIPHYIDEDLCGTGTTDVWLKMSELPPSEVKTVAMLYGNSSAPSTSDGDSVFIFFDNFEDNDLAEWNTTTGWSVSSAQVKSGTYSAQSGTNWGHLLSVTFGTTTSGVLELDMRINNVGSSHFYPFNPRLVGGWDVEAYWSVPLTSGNVRHWTGGGFSNYPTPATYTDDVWYHIESKYDFGAGTQGKHWLFIDDTNYGGASGVDIVGWGGDPHTGLEGWNLRVSDPDNGQYYWIDNVMVRSFAAYDAEPRTTVSSVENSANLTALSDATAFQIQVIEDGGSWASPVWDSGKTATTGIPVGNTHDEVYGGASLALDGTVYYQRWRFWDSFDQATNWSSGEELWEMSIYVPPTAPTISGTTTGFTLQDYTFEFTADDKIEGLSYRGSIIDDSEGGSASALGTAGEVFVDNGRAYVTTYVEDALSIFDISDPTNPTELGVIVDDNQGGTAAGLNGPQDVAVSGNYAYVVSNGDHSLSVVDVSNPASPTEVAVVYDNSQGGAATGLQFPSAITVAGNRAYVVSGTEAALSVFNIANPLTPTQLGTIVDNSQGGTATVLDQASDVVVVGNYAYVTTYSSSESGLAIFDISNPASITQVGSIVDDAAGGSGSRLTYAYRVAVEGDYAYVVSSDEFGEHAFTVIDISNPTSPTEVAVRYDSGLPGGTMRYFDFLIGLAVYGDYAVVLSSGNHAVNVIDISNPLSPEIALEALDDESSDAPNADLIANDLQGVNAVFMDGEYLYITSQQDDALSVIRYLQTDQIRYGIDWDNDSSVDEWIPSDTPVDQYVPSGDTVSGTNQWSTPAVYTFQALAEDDAGAQSGWSSHVITIIDSGLLPFISINALSNPILYNSNATIQWETSDADSCVAVDGTANWQAISPVPLQDGGTPGNFVSEQLTATTTFTLECTNTYGTISQSVEVVVLPPECSDGVDNADLDTLADVNDPGCYEAMVNIDDEPVYDPLIASEGSNPECSDGIDNDLDGRIDSADGGCYENFNPALSGDYVPEWDRELTCRVPTTGVFATCDPDESFGVCPADCAFQLQLFQF